MELTTIRTTRDADNIVTVWLDAPGKSVNTISPPLLADLSMVLSELSQTEPAGVIFASAKKENFVAGADLFEIRKMDRDEIGKFIGEGQKVFQRITSLPMPTCAAINGDCLGGGLELALACTYRVAADSGSINIGLPEVKLGILPAWGGTTRLPRLIGLPKALPLLLAGKTLPPKKAMRIGIVDEVVRPEVLPAACKRMLASHRQRHTAQWTQRFAASTSLFRSRIFSAAISQTKQKTYGHYPAPLKLIEVLRTGFDHGFDAGLKAELDALLELMDSNACRNLMRLFFLRQSVKRSLGKQLAAAPREVKYAAVIGGGTMGAGIVHAMVKAGIQVRLIEVDPKAVAAGLARIKAFIDEDVAAGRMNSVEARRAFDRVAPSTEWSGLELADVVIEAVVEKMDLKREIFTKLDQLTRPDCVLATNTSSLLVGEMADAANHRGRVVGIHFFNPVSKMPLVEVVRAEQSDEQSLATAVGLVARIGKTPVLVNDAPGFLVNRVLVPYLGEALVAAGEGVPVPMIDAALRRWGMPMGPFELLDEIGLDVAAHVLKELGAHLPDTIPLPPGIYEGIKNGWLGKKSGRGFYEYGKADHKDVQPDLNSEMAALVYSGPAPSAPQGDAAVREQEIQWRLVMPMINEAARLLDEGVTDSTDVIDLATVLGTGLAPFRGGLAHFIDATGIDVIVTKMTEMSAKHGPRFAPDDLLRQLAAAHIPLAELASLHGEPSPRHHIAPWRVVHQT